MIDPELVAFHAVIIKARTPEDVFGPLVEPKHDTAKSLYRKFARIVHEDRHVAEPGALTLAHEAMSLLSRFWNEAQEKIDRGTYGDGRTFHVSATLTGKKHAYHVDEAIATGDLARIFGARVPTMLGPTKRAIVKVSKAPVVNDLLAHEAIVLADLVAGAELAPVYQRFFPPFLEAFRVKEKGVVKHVNVMVDHRDGPVYTLHDLVASYPQGIDPRHFVWIFKRLLSVLGYAHGRRWVHGAVLPQHILVRPKDHSLILVDWSYAVEQGRSIVAVSPGYGAYYPPEVALKMKASPATDLYMAAQCMKYVLGVTPAPFLALIEACLLKSPSRRWAEAFSLYDNLVETAKKMYGPSRFVELALS